MQGADFLLIIAALLLVLSLSPTLGPAPTACQIGCGKYGNNIYEGLSGNYNICSILIIYHDLKLINESLFYNTLLPNSKYSSELETCVSESYLQ